MQFLDLFQLHSEPDLLNGYMDRYNISPIHIANTLLMMGNDKAEGVSELQLRIIMNHPDLLNMYIQSIRRPLSDAIEDIIAKDQCLSIAYVKTCLYRPFPKAESMLNKCSKYWEMYVLFLKQRGCRPVHLFIQHKEFHHGFARRDVSK